MKRTINLLMVMVISTLTFAQVPNGGFENWTGTEPDNWLTNNIAPFELYPVTQSSDAHSGASAVRGEIIEYVNSGGEVYHPVIQSSGGVPVTQDHASVSGWYKFNQVQATASFVLSCTVLDGSGQPTGIGLLEIEEGTVGYQAFTLPIDYSILGSEPAVSMTITFGLSDNDEASAVGSWFLVDDVTLDDATDLLENDLKNAEVGIPYPIPFLDKVAVPITVASSSYFKVEVIDLIGRPVAILNNDILAQGSHLLDWTPGELVSNGVYFLRISSREGSATRRILLER